MSDKRCTLEVKFKDAETARLAKPRLVTFMRDVERTYDDWQNHRDDGAMVDFYERHRKVLNALGVWAPVPNHSLAGILDSFSHLKARVVKDRLLLSMTVWSGSTLDPLSTYALLAYGAEDVTWREN